jgi:hypothetical protein
MILLFLGSLSPLSRCQQHDAAPRTEENVQQYLNTLKSGTICARRKAIFALHHLGKSAIPLLIDHIDDRQVASKSTLMLANPILSYAPPGSQRDEFSGVIYAYVVELILARRSLHDDLDCTFILSTGEFAYPHGLIIRDSKVISATDLAQVKQVYSRWWEENRHKSLAALRLDWEKSVRPLTGSQYNWM